jgi:hypothetical protein
MRRGLSKLFEKFFDVHAKGVGDYFDILQADVALAGHNPGKVAFGDIGFKSKSFDGHFFFLEDHPYVGDDAFVDFFHANIVSIFFAQVVDWQST